MMFAKKCLAFLCAVVLLAAVLVAPVSAASASGKTNGGSAGSVNVTAALYAYPTYGQASSATVVPVTPSANPSTSVTIRCVNTWTGEEGLISNWGDSSVYVHRTDPYSGVHDASSQHSFRSVEWGSWVKALYEMT